MRERRRVSAKGAPCLKKAGAGGRRKGTTPENGACGPPARPCPKQRKGGDGMAKLDIPNTGSMTVKAPKPTASTKKPVVKTGK